jgi:hypothetical protein
MRRVVIALVVMVGALVSAAATGAVATPPFQTVMTGLDNPRGLAWGPEGALYVAEAGTGGPVPCGVGPEGPEFAGFSGGISRLWKGAQTRIVSGLPSHAGPGGVAALGPHDIAMLGRGDARFSIGWGNDPALRSACGAVGPKMDWIARLTASGNWRLETDLGAYEAVNNPDGGVPDSDPYGLLAEPGQTIATDAGGNDLLRIGANGSISKLATFPSRAQGRFTDAVPTTVARGPDGAYYVGELTGAPFLPGQANVYRVANGVATPYLTGFSFIIDLTFGPDGSLYVLEFATGAGLSGPGELWRVKNGARTLVATGLVAPGSVTLGPDGSFYISNCSIFPGTGPFPCNGQVVRIPG